MTKQLTTLTAFGVTGFPMYDEDYPERHPTKLILCPYCRGFHLAPTNAKSVKLTCKTEHPRPDYAELLDCGPAPTMLLGAFMTPHPVAETSDLWRLQPEALWSVVTQTSETSATALKAVELE